MDAELTQSFIEEAESYLPTIRGGILLCLQNGGNAHSELETAVRQAHTMKGAAMMVGFEEVGKVSEKLEKQLRKIFEKKETLTEEVSRQMLDNLSQIESSLMNVQMNTDEFSFDFNEFIEASFDNLQFNPQKEIGIASEETIGSDADSFAQAWGEEEFEIDDEMLEVFALEAEDLLKNINNNLAILAKQPADREALMEIRRNAHTFKGSAGIVGLNETSQLAHRVEDLLDYLAENEIESNKNIFDILQASTDCLSAMTAGETSEQLTNKVQRVYKDFDKLINSLKGIAVEIPEEKQIAVEIPEEKQIAVAAKAAAASPAVKKRKTEESKPTQNSKSIVRVSLERLDDLVKIVSDLVISRSVFEQRLGELDRQIEELHHSTRRLQRSTTRLETEFEADTLNLPNARYQISGSGFQTSNFASSHHGLSEFDSLEFDRYTDFHQTTRELIETTNDTSAINSSLDNLRSNLEMLFTGQSRLIEEMQDKLLRIRMVKFDSLSARLHRTVRVTCDEENKQADLTIEGEHQEIDTQILDSLIEPLLHLLRNSVAHGIETPDTRRLLGKPEKGAIKLRVTSEGTHIVLTVTDDGRGISPTGLKAKAVENGFITEENAQNLTEEEIYELVFLQGLTTAEKISQVSGRGVGLNAVKTTVERQQGTISISSKLQQGTTFTLRLPMALAVTRSLLVNVSGQKFAFPLNLVKQITEISPVIFEKANHDKYLQMGKIKYRLAHLNDLLGLHTISAQTGENVTILLLDTPENPCALLVDKIIKPEELVVKPLGAPLNNMLGAAILGDGSVIPILDLIYLLKRKISGSKFITPTPNESFREAKITTVRKELKVMIVDDSPSVRHLNSKIVKNAGFEAIVAKDGLEAFELLQSSDNLPDIILTDVEMPRMDGYELLASVKNHETLEKIPVIMITSRASDKHRQKALKLGVSEYLTKPFDDAKLVETIRSLSGV
jgi:chemosensory pili system protein ChpA (sensor histidine kinase/response regulator)